MNQMTLAVIGSGFGRTGTASLKLALEQLGFGPCHHMEEVFGHPEQVPHWQAIARGEMPPMATVFAGYRSQVDWPGAHVWRELAAAFPAAKVIHSLRPAEAWWKSFSGTIGALMAGYAQAPLPPHMRAMLDAMDEVIVKRTLGGDPADRSAVLASYQRREQDVRAAIPPERLLVFDVAEGWGPLCDFLDVPAPATPFPHANTTEEFWKLVRGEGKAH
jgi:Sulfotransferase domain